ncbi:MAG: putative amidophosphoribosyltransferase [Verrucomicrobiales bacterium]|jgi:predicted amidophosphoribosyltransferase
MVSAMWLFESLCVVCHAPANGVCDICVDRLLAPAVPPLLGIEQSTVLCRYEGTGAELVTAVKFRNRRYVLTPLVDALVPSLNREYDTIVSVPGNVARVRERGFDLPALIAKRISRRLGVPISTPLSRVDDGSQLGRGRVQRQGVEFRALSRVPERVLLVDDVITTGATAVACAITLGLAGARSTSFVALAATPSPDRSPVG